MQRSAGPGQQFETVILLLGVGPLRLVVPTRVVAVIDEPDQYAHAYGTLPGHPNEARVTSQPRWRRRGQSSSHVPRKPRQTWMGAFRISFGVSCGVSTVAT